MPPSLHRTPRTPALLLLALLALAARRAAAQNADGVLMGAEAATTAGAVLASSGDVAGAYYNPAGLAAVEGPSAQFSASAYELSTIRLARFVDTTLPWTRSEQTIRSTTLFTVPAVAAFGLRLGGRLGVAAGVWVPSHEEVTFTSDLRSSGPYSPGGSVTSATYVHHLALSQKLERTYFGAAAGLTIARGVRAGLSGFVTYDALDEFVSLFAAIATDSPVPAESGGTVSVTASGAPSQVAMRFGAGVQWDLSPSLTLAVAAKTPSFAIAREGTLSTVVSSTALLPGVPPAILFAQDRGAPLRLSEPWRVAAGGAAALGAWSLRAEADWQAAGDGLRAVVNARLGALRDGGDVRWGAGLLTDRSREVARTGGFAVNYYGAAAGLSFRPPAVRAARARGGTWDVWTSLAVRYALGLGETQGLGIAPLGEGSSPRSSGVRVHLFTFTLGGLVQF